MQIWIDADACPVVVKEIIYRASERLQLQLSLVANQALQVPESPLIECIKVAAGADMADAEIVRRLSAGDLLITGDIPLAADALAKGAYVLNHRGEMFSSDSIKAALSVRSFMDQLRGSGVQTGGPAPFSAANRKSFADALDRFLAKHAC